MDLGRGQSFVNVRGHRYHQVVQAGFEVLVSDHNTTAWSRFEQDRIVVIADKFAGLTEAFVIVTPSMPTKGDLE